MKISFDDTVTAFNYKTSRELKRAGFLFQLMSIKWLMKLILKISSIAFKMGLPIKWLIKGTLFDQFVGGETLQETSQMAARLSKFNVKIILDYGVEGKENDESFDKATAEFIKAITYAASQPNIPFISLKITGIGRFGLLERIAGASNYQGIMQGEIPLDILSSDEKEEWDRLLARMCQIAEAATSKNIGVLVDAEESWIQDTIDGIAIMMTQEFNIGKAVVYNTAQLYRKDRLQFVRDCSGYALKNGFICAMKLVRGAYMERERRRAAELNYNSPVNETRKDTDNDYNSALEYCINPVNGVHIIIGSHNEYSNLYATQLMEKSGLSANDTRIHFSQLFGMSDNITFNLAKAGFYVSKYLPFGPFKDVIPYLLRRAEENSSVDKQSGRELSLIKKELKRRSVKSVNG